MRSADSLFCSWLFSFWQDTTVPVGRCVMRTAESVVLTLWPPGPEERKTSIRRSFGLTSTSTSSASGSTMDARRAGMQPALGLGDRDPLHAVHAGLVLQPAVDTRGLEALARSAMLMSL